MEQAKEVNIIPSIAAKNKHYESAHVARFELLLLLYLTFNTFHIYTILHAGSRVKGILFFSFCNVILIIISHIPYMDNIRRRRREIYNFSEKACASEKCAKYVIAFSA